MSTVIGTATATASGIANGNGSETASNNTKYTGEWVAFADGVVGKYAGSCMYTGTPLRQFGPSSNVMQCGPYCKLTTGCIFFAFAGNTTGQYSYGTCSLFAVGGDTGGPFDASVNDVCGYYGTEADADAIPVFASISSSISTISTVINTTTNTATTAASTSTTNTTNINTDNGNNAVAIVAATVFLVILVASTCIFFYVRHIRRIKSDHNDSRKSTPLLQTTNATATTAVARDDSTSFYSLDSDILRQAAKLPMSKHIVVFGSADSVMLANSVGLGGGSSKKNMKKKSANFTVMPKSKRNKIVALTRTEKKGKAEKTILFDKVRAAVDANTHAYIISVSNMRNSILKTMRMGLKKDSSADSSVTFFFGNNKVIAKSLGGPDREHEYKDGLRFLGENLKGAVGLCFSDMDVDQIRSAFSEYVHIDFARNGVKATKTVTLPAGPVMRRVEAVDIDEIDESLAPSYLPESASSEGEVIAFPNNMETQLRGLGMPTLLKGGVIMLMRDYTICTEGETLSSNQAQLLKHFNLKMAKFNVRIVGHWSEDAGYENVDGVAEHDDDDAEDEAVEMENE